VRAHGDADLLVERHGRAAGARRRYREHDGALARHREHLLRRDRQLVALEVGERPLSAALAVERRVDDVIARLDAAREDHSVAARGRVRDGRQRRAVHRDARLDDVHGLRELVREVNHGERAGDRALGRRRVTLRRVLQRRVAEIVVDHGPRSYARDRDLPGRRDVRQPNQKSPEPCDSDGFPHDHPSTNEW
jgi:hypothetical protein